MAAPLTKRQKYYLVTLARQAFEGECRRKNVEGRIPGAEEKFRHEAVAKACGKRGLRCCSQDDYGYVKAHLQGLLGAEGAAVRSYVRQATNERRVVEWKIVKRCEEYGIPLAKAEGICRQMTRGRGLQEVEETATLWNVFFKLRFYEPKGVKRET